VTRLDARPDDRLAAAIAAGGAAGSRSPGVVEIRAATLTVAPASPIAGRAAVAHVVSGARGRHVLIVVRAGSRRSKVMRRIGPDRLRATIVFPAAGRWTARVTIGSRVLVRRTLVVKRPQGAGGTVDARFREWRVTPASHPHDVAPAPDGTIWYTEQLAGYLGRLDPQRVPSSEYRSAQAPPPTA
jgi:streptogramin lyase